MKTSRQKFIKSFRLVFIALITNITFSALAQLPTIQYLRQYDKTGLNIFEPTKHDTTPFTGMKVRIGGDFALDYQALRDQNNAVPVFVKGVNINQLMPLTNGFDLAMANLNIDVQLEDGLRLNLAMYLSTRHHTDTWVKGGYIQIDKLLMFKSPVIDDIMKNFTIKSGDYEMDYGDQHFRRTDGGNGIYNPFVENYIMDEIGIEIGSEIYYHPKNGIIAMVGLSDGELDPLVIAPTKVDTATGILNTYAPAFHAKLGYDKQVNSDFRFRITGSFYEDKSAAANPLYFGDRTGSHYFYVMENTAATSDVNAWSGRYNPQFSEEVSTFMINPFIKYKGLEFFGTYEMAEGRMITEPTMRKATQYAADLIYRFPQKTEDFWVGVRYNSLTTTLPLNPTEVTINREVGSIGWFASKNILLKLEYVNQQYLNFPSTDIRSGGKFNGFMFETAIGF